METPSVLPHLTARERSGLFYMHQHGYSLRAISRRLNRSHSTLSRELKRNARPHGQCYCDRFAQKRADERRRTPRHSKLNVNQKLIHYIEQKLALGWSPEIISGRIHKDYPRKMDMRISHESIYQRLYRDAGLGCQMYLHLPRSHRKIERKAASFPLSLSR